MGAELKTVRLYPSQISKLASLVRERKMEVDAAYRRYSEKPVKKLDDVSMMAHWSSESAYLADLLRSLLP